MNVSRQIICGVWLLGILASGLHAAEDKPAAGLDFDRAVRPILSNTCFKCHGPDGAERKSELRLDRRDSAIGPAESGKAAITPGKPNESELIRRITSNDPDEVMPPPDSGKKLTDEQKTILRQWITQGADFKQHWSFVPPTRPAVPKAGDGWARNAIDRYIAEKLASKGLKPSPEADRATLIRRLSLDLTGLPPTIAEIDTFLADKSIDAYEKLVDRLLASPHYGERMALEWLDAARFADTHGYHIDSGRDMSRWREWVIEAFNSNKPFDKFTIDQLAGDLAPGATLDQKIASGFNRNHMINFEGGAIPDEYHTAYIVDRVNTTTTVWLGLTVACSQCHDHKYDPLTQKEYYQFFAFFHNVPENGLDGSKGNAAPLLTAPTAAEQRKIDDAQAAIAKVEQQLAAPRPEVDAAQAAWEKTAAAELQVVWSTLEPNQMTSEGGATLTRLEDQTILASGKNPPVESYTITAGSTLREITAIRLEVFPDDSFPAKGPGRSANGNAVLTEFRAAAKQPLDADVKPLAFKAASADFSQATFAVANAIDNKQNTGWAIHPEVGKPHVAVFELSAPLKLEPGATLSLVLDFRTSFGQHQFGKFRLSATGSSQPHGAAKISAAALAALGRQDNERTPAERDELRKYYRENISPATKPLVAQLDALRKTLADASAKLTNTMVMQEMPNARETFLLVRGQYDKKGEKVVAGVPSSLPPLPAKAPGNRLGLAEWLVDPGHPLTSRVTVNRYWQMYFGNGIVKTSEDFGSQGEYPSHPELLDWLAVEFIESGWNVKAMQRLIVTSATYRQASAVSPEMLAKDPENRLLGRGVRLRLPAEFIRDLALAASGLLNDEIGGKSVSPYQPPGLWEELASRADGANWTAQTYTQSHGKDLYRRTMYTFWKRTSPPPTLSTFDAPDRETCTVRRARTNTPLQSLVLMNDPTYVEASRKLAERLLTEAPNNVAARITHAYKLLLARQPSTRELGVLTKIYDQQLSAFRQDPAAVKKLLTIGESPANDKLDATDLAAWAMISSVILNLDETVNKG